MTERTYRSSVIDRRSLLRSAALGVAGVTLPSEMTVAAAPLADTGRDQTAALQAAIDDAARRKAPLVLAAGTYRSGTLRLPDGAHLIGLRGATRLVFTGSGASLIETTDAARLSLSGLVLDGGGHGLPTRRGLLHLSSVSDLAILECSLTQCGATAIWLDRCAGTLQRNRIADIADSGIVSFNGAGLRIADNEIERCGDNGIEILRDTIGEDGALISGNRIRAIRARAGGSGQHGNAIVLHRAGGAIVSANHIRDCDYSAIRANSTRNIQIATNNIADTREVAIYSEFSFEGSVISANVVERAAIGISVCNFNEGGRLAVVKDNIIRNLLDRRPEGSRDGQGGVGIYVEADTLVSGNLVERAPLAGVLAGWGVYLRDVLIAANIVRDSGMGVAVSALNGAGRATIRGNVLSGCRNGAIVGLDHARPVTGDLTAAGARVPPHLALDANQTI